MKLIDKDAVLAEIESLLDKGRYHEEYDCAYRDGNNGNNGALYALKGKLDTIEVKEVDFKKEYKEFITCDNGRSMFETAKHFFELGLRASNPLTWEDIKTIQNISGEVYAEVAKGKDDFYSIYPTEQLFLEEVLKRFKEKKGESV